MPTYLAPISRGLGDLVISLPAVQHLIDAGEETYLVARSAAQLGLAHYIPGLAGVIDEPLFLKQPLPTGSRYINLRDHPLQTDFRWDTAEFKQLYPEYLIVDVTEHIAHDKGIQADFQKLKPLPHSICSELSDVVLFVPGSSNDVKSWPTSHWKLLSERLNGKVMIIGEPKTSQSLDAVLAADIKWLPTPTFAHLLDALSSALAVVSVDTGPMHLAIHQGTPTVGLYLNNPFYLRREPHAEALIGPACAPTCIQRAMAAPLNEEVEWESWQQPEGWHCDESPETRCMGQVTADSVMEKLQVVLKHKFPVPAGVQNR